MSWQAAKQDMAFDLEQKAWEIYCKETAGDVHVVGFFHELPFDVYQIYMGKARELRGF